jgi:type II secretory pathway pseudopilin PulG
MQTRRRVEGEQGETLLELIIAVAIMGIAVVAIVGGLGTSILMSDIHRKQASAGAYVRDYAEAIDNAVAAGGYVACNAASYAGTAIPGFDATKYQKSIVAGSARYWNGTGWQAACPAIDTGLQQLTLQVKSIDSIGSRATETLVIVVRKPCGPGSSCT